MSFTLFMQKVKQCENVVLTQYQMETLKYLSEESPSFISSREVWETLDERHRRVSRASIINFLNFLVDESILDCEETTGRGGIHRLYRFPEGETLDSILGLIGAKMIIAIDGSLPISDEAWGMALSLAERI